MFDENMVLNNNKYRFEQPTYNFWKALAHFHPREQQRKLNKKIEKSFKIFNKIKIASTKHMLKVDKLNL